ncbi:hypothetical protein D3Z55_24285 [Clostridiaceae bacterium]|nr:hypothetical protein [Clostridiaceae bacterium]
MKKLIYNENTKVIDIVECEEIIESKNEKVEVEAEVKNQGRIKRVKEFFESKTEKGRNFLNRNKIFFEVFSYLFVGVMGIIISYVGWQTNIKTAEIYQRQLEIMENDSEPRFSSELFWIDAENMEYAYKIENDGGIASDGIVCPIVICTFLINDKLIDVYFNDALAAEKLESDKQCMIDYRRSKKIIKEIEKELGEQCFSEIEYVMLEYINYKNERVFNYYYLGIDGMYLVEREELIDSDGIQIIYNGTLDIKEISDRIKNVSED